MKKTKIICSIGPASSSVEVMSEMVKAGMNVARINFSHATLEEKVQHLEEEIARNARDFVKLNELTKEKDEAEEKLSEKMDRWVYLNDLNDRINAQ